MTTLGALLLAAIAFLAFPMMIAMAFSEHYRLEGPYGKSLVALALAAAIVLISPLGLPMEILAPIAIVGGTITVVVCWIGAVRSYRREAKHWTNASAPLSTDRAPRAG